MSIQEIAKWVAGVVVSAFIAGFTVKAYLDSRDAGIKQEILDDVNSRGLSIKVERRACSAGPTLNTSSCTVQCSEGMKVLGGGCSAAGSGHPYVQVYESIPTVDKSGWICTTSVDRADKQVSVKATGFASCARE